MEYVRIAVNVPQNAALFDYSVPENLAGRILPGQLVTVPFGRQVVQGVVWSVLDREPAMQTRPVLDVLDPLPVLTPAQRALAEDLADASLSPLASCITLMLPPGLSRLADTTYSLNGTTQVGGQTHILNETQRRLLEILKERGPLRGRQLERALPRRNWRAAAQKLLQWGLLYAQPVLPEPLAHPKTVRAVRLICSGEEADQAVPTLGRKDSPAQKRREIMLRGLIREGGRAEATWLYAESAAAGLPASATDLRAMAKRGLVQLVEQETWRDPLVNLKGGEEPVYSLTERQKEVWERLQSAFRGAEPGKRPFLLHGVTGSGKTEIYLHAVDEALQMGRQAIVLVPEISLTPQTVRRFYARFPRQVGLVHSRLSDGERYDTWRRARAGEISVVVGARSALFTPFPDPGLIIVDECHDDSYYQADMPPAYDSRELAAAYARREGAVCVFGSATPDVAQYARAGKKAWTLLEMPERVAAYAEMGKDLPDETSKMRDLPRVEVIDMRQELKGGNRTIFSLRLNDELRNVLERGEQAILFLNRRGSATYVFCRDCGHVMRCPRCDMPLTYHEITWEASTGKLQPPLRCHFCRYERKMPQTCPVCGSARIRQFGTGTQKVETQVRERYPQARVLRWDADTTRHKDAHTKMMDALRRHEVDILIGTQMLTKGLDLPLVTLVGVVLADVGINLPDYRAEERVFQLLTQVAGRAGRSPLGGRVILQTFQPDHFVIQAAARHSYADFCARELENRRAFGFPPFVRILRMEFRHTDAARVEENARRTAEQVTHWLREGGHTATEMTGPLPCFFEKMGGIYRWQILLRGPDPAAVLRGRPLKDVLVQVDPPSIL